MPPYMKEINGKWVDINVKKEVDTKPSSVDSGERGDSSAASTEINEANASGVESDSAAVAADINDAHDSDGANEDGDVIEEIDTDEETDVEVYTPRIRRRRTSLGPSVPVTRAVAKRLRCLSNHLSPVPAGKSAKLALRRLNPHNFDA